MHSVNAPRTYLCDKLKIIKLELSVVTRRGELRRRFYSEEKRASKTFLIRAFIPSACFPFCRLLVYQQ